VLHTKRTCTGFSLARQPPILKTGNLPAWNISHEDLTDLAAPDRFQQAVPAEGHSTGNESSQTWNLPVGQTAAVPWPDQLGSLMKTPKFLSLTESGSKAFQVTLHPSPGAVKKHPEEVPGRRSV
jgi:beta-xylosidase